jgi:hypothetical protein
MSKAVKAVGKAVKSVGKAVVGAVKGVVKAIGKVVSSIADIVGSAFLGIFGSPGAPDAPGEAERQQGVLIQKQGSNVNVPIVYGYRKVGGIVTFAGTGSDNNKYLYVAYVFSEGLVEGLNEIYIDDNQLPVTVVQRLNAGETVDVNEGKYNGRVQLRWYPGLYYTNPASSPVGSQVKAGIFAGAPEFESNMVYNGLAVLFARYEWRKVETQEDSDNNPFNGGIPQMQVCLLGKRVQTIATIAPGNDELTATMTANSNTYWAGTAYDANAGAYSTNPVEILHDYLRNPRYGKGLALDEMDKTTWINAANKCNQRVTYYTGAVGPILTTNYVVDTGQTLFNNVKSLLSGFRAYMPWVQGKYKLKIEDAGNETDILSGVATIVQTITKNEIVGDVVYTGIDRNSKYTQVAVTYVDPDQKWSNQVAVFPETDGERQIYIDRDGGRENKGDFTFGGLTNKITALDMARLLFNKSRFQESCSLKISAQGFELEPGDNIYIQSNILNFGTVPWRVISIKLNNDYTFDLGCIRNPDGIYPYGRYGEPDIVRPTYIPKGNEIYYPNTNRPLVGIFPPSRAPFPAGWAGSPPSGNINPTNPFNPVTPGGGVGDPGSTSNVTSPAPTPVAPPTATTNDVINPISAVFDTATNQWTVKFQKPNTATYGGVKVWYKPNTTTSYIELGVLSTGADSFTFTAASDINLQYTVITRVRYGNDDYSTDSVTFQLIRFTGLSDIRRTANFNFGSIGSIPANFYNYGAQPYVVSYVAGTDTPRSMTLTVREPLITGVVGSTNIDSVYIYYKTSSSSSYTLYEHKLPQTYAPNQEFSILMSNRFGTSTTTYDFVVQFKFRDGRMGTVQYQQRNVSNTGTSYGIASSNSVVSAGVVPVAGGGISNDLTRPSIRAILGINNSMRVYVQDPELEGMTNFAGIIVEVARLIPGSTISYTTTTRSLSQLSKQFGGQWPTSYFVDVPLISSLASDYNVVVSLQYYSGTTLTQTSVGTKISGRFNPGSSIDQLGNMTLDPNSSYPLLKADSGTTAVAVGGIVAITPTAVQVRLLVNNESLPSDPIKTSRLQILFDSAGITGFTKLRVYRRLPTQAVWEYTDITTNAQIRFSSFYNQTFGDGSRPVSSQQQELYLRVYTATASTHATRVQVNMPTVQGTYRNAMGTTSFINLSTDTALAAQLDSAVQASTVLVRYNLVAQAFSGDPTFGTGFFS